MPPYNPMMPSNSPASTWQRLNRGAPALGTRKVGGGYTQNPWAKPNLPAPGAPMVGAQVPAWAQPQSQAAPAQPQPGYNYDPTYWQRFQSGTPDVGDTNRFMAQLIGGYSPEGGSFAVGGDPRVREFIASEAGKTARGYQGQAVSAASAAGVDPAVRNWMRLQALMSSQEAGANAINSYAGQSGLAMDSYRRALLEALVSSNLGIQRQNNQGEWAMKQSDPSRRDAWSDFFGGVGGAAVGGAAGGWGQAGFPMPWSKRPQPQEAVR